MDRKEFSLDKKEEALLDLEAFIRLVHPHRLLGRIHLEVIRWWTREAAKSHQLLLLPRDHQKSALMAYRVAWRITRDPTVRILYISSTANLATKQLKFIKDILLSDTYKRYWPEMVEEQESRREKWTETEISVDHPLRKAETIRDPTVFTAGLTTNTTGLHCDVAALDDVIVETNAYTADGRRKVKSQISYLASVCSVDAEQWVTGTRYFPKDLYNDMMNMTYDIVDDQGNVITTEHLYETFPHTQVESVGDGTGEYLWPRTQRASDSKWFGFNQQILSKKKAQYDDLNKYRAQYYNNPNDPSTATINTSMFQYYDRLKLTQSMGKWYFGNNKLNIGAAIDFGINILKHNDYSCISVVGVDSRHRYFILDIDRFKTTKISDMFDRILKLYNKWGFTKIRAEITAQQGAIVRSLKDDYIRPNGLALSVVESTYKKSQGSKEERLESILQPKYSNQQVWHYSGGNCGLLEEELLLQKPPHDDIKDSVSQAMESLLIPSTISNNRLNRIPLQGQSGRKMYHPRFGGVNH